MGVKKDIVTRADIVKMVNAFYESTLDDPLLGPIFIKIAGLKLSEHLTILYDFWESALFQVGKYKRETFRPHWELHMKHRLEAIHFERWLKIFNTSMDENFQGVKATQAKERALTIAMFIKVKLQNLDRMNLELNN